MIKFYVYNHHDGTYTIMIVDNDLPLFVKVVNEEGLPAKIERFKEVFSDTGREIRVFEN